MKHRILLFSLLLLAVLASKAENTNTEKTDSIQMPTEVFSVLTCSPGEEIYSLFGHTAIRYKDTKRGTDIVFNYGIFSFSSPNFIWRFIKGETDYMLGITSFKSFYEEYYERNSPVFEQKLNLTEEETRQLLSVLLNDYKPENRVYRYNFFYNNCTTRAKDRIESIFEKGINYRKEMPELSFRDIIHQFTKGHEWSELGIDLCIASPADKKITKEEMMFAPFYYKDLLEHAYIADSGKPLTQKAELIVNPTGTNTTDNYPSPFACFITLWIITIIICIIEYKTNKIFWGYDIILFGGTGISGLIIAFLAFFSTHPAVDHNYLLFFMHPLHLIFLPFFIRKEIKRQKSYYHIINTAVLIIFFATIPIIPQQFNYVILFLALSLLTRSLVYTYKFRRNKQ